jgi:hypothetical protein
MKVIQKAAIACVLATVAMLPLAANAQTGPRNQDTFFTFSQAVELPGATLPAGRYLFVLGDSQSNRHIVRVMSDDRKTMHTTVLAIPYYSNERPSSEPQVRFLEGPETGPQAVKIWFYPGTSTGHELIYPRSQAMKLAARVSEPVLTTKTEDTSGELARVDANGSTAEVAANTSPETGALNGSQPNGAQPNGAEPAPAPAPAAAPMPERAPEPAPARERDELPATATVLPLLALLGIGSLVANRVMRRTRRNSAQTPTTTTTTTPPSAS